MKLALVADAFDPTNGWGRYAGELARGLIAAGVDLRLVSPRRYCRMDDLCAYPDFRDLPSFQHETRHFAKLLARSIVPLRRALRGVDVIHCMVEPYAPAVALAAWRRPYLVSLVGTYALPSARHPLEARLLRWALRRARRLPAISAYTESKVQAEIGCTHTTVVPLGVNASDFAAPDPAPERDRAVARLRSEIQGLRYVIVGPYVEASPYVRGLRRDIEELALSDVVTLAGPVSHADLVQWYHRAGLVVMPYREAAGDIEGFGLVLLEAGAAGTPVVSTRRSGAEQPVRHDLNGLLVEPDDVEALGAAMRKLLTDAEIWRRLAAGGAARAAELTWERSTEQLLNVYAETLGAPLVAA